MAWYRWWWCDERGHPATTAAGRSDAGSDWRVCPGRQTARWVRSSCYSRWPLSGPGSLGVLGIPLGLGSGWSCCGFATKRSSRGSAAMVPGC